MYGRVLAFWLLGYGRQSDRGLVEVERDEPRERVRELDE